jgi:hypothetical protein
MRKTKLSQLRNSDLGAALPTSGGGVLLILTLGNGVANASALNA